MMKSVSYFLYSILALAMAVLPAAASDLGIILMHGKGGLPTRQIAKLASALEGKGYLVSAPTMPWASGRMYDATFEQAMEEIDREVDALRQKGAKRIVVAGHSMGANAALGYAAARDGVSAVIALATGHSPDSPNSIKRQAEDLGRAKELIAAGKGKEAFRFNDSNQGRTFPVVASAEVYVSWMDPEGSAVMPKSAASFKLPTPLLLIVGSREPFARGQDYIFDKAPPHGKSRFTTVTADHLQVPAAAVQEVLAWLAAL